MTTFILITATRKKTAGNAGTNNSSENIKNRKKSKNLETNLIQVPYIRYTITFREKFVFRLFDSENEVNAIYPIFAKELNLFIRLTDIKAQKIDDLILNTYGRIIQIFLVTNKANQV